MTDHSDPMRLADDLMAESVAGWTYGRCEIAKKLRTLAQQHDNAPTILPGVIRQLAERAGEASGVPDGWQLVPKVMTLEMDIAFCDAWFSRRRAIDDSETQDAWAAALAAAPTPEAQQGVARTGAVADISDEDLLRRAMSNLCSRARRRPAWDRVSDVFGLGSTYSAQLCRRFGRDPETGKARTPQANPSGGEA